LTIGSRASGREAPGFSGIKLGLSVRGHNVNVKLPVAGQMPKGMLLLFAVLSRQPFWRSSERLFYGRQEAAA
jgi:hypothetical protein